MNDSSGKTNSGLAITEKKTTQRSGGCIGIFFQLFDWNRKLAKKKLFSKKLLPPARAKQPSKKFKGDEKMTNSKHHLIANENSGGFPSSRKGGNQGVAVEKKHEMRVPGLVARLMGLESIPASQRDKSKKASFSDSCGDGQEDPSGNNYCELDREGLNSETRVAKHDSRPQKLQRTGTYESRAVTRFGAEALQIKNVLSRSRKHHHPKFAPPLKSPRINSGKSVSRSSRLIGAATKILEPGLQATSRAKCSIMYSESKCYPKNDLEAEVEVAGNKLTDLEKQSDYDASAVTSLMGLASCKNCGNVLDVVDRRPDVEGQPAINPPIVSDVKTASSVASAERKASSLMSADKQASDIILLRSREPCISLVPEEGGISNETQSCNEPTDRRMPLPNEHRAPWNSRSHPCRNLDDTASSITFKHKSQTQERMSTSHRLPRESRMSSQHIKLSSDSNTANGAKDFVALNRSLSGQTRLRSPNKVDSSKFNVEKKPCNRQEDSLSRVRTLERKRRTPNVAQVESTAYVHTTMGKQREIRFDAMPGKRRDINVSPINSWNNRSKRGAQGKTDNVVDKKVNDVVSFTFNSPLKHKTGIPIDKEDPSGENEVKTPCQKTLPLTGDALGAFLEQKLKELTSHEDDEPATGALPKKSTAMILQELISALSAEHLTSHNDHMVNADTGFQNGAKKERLLGSVYYGNHLSPGSVLEASFSSSSLDESSGHNLHPDSMSCSYDQPEQLEPDAELLDSAASFKEGKIGSEALNDLVSQILESINYFGVRLTTSKVSHVKDVVLNAELLLGNTTIHGEDRVPHLFIARILTDELDNMADDVMGTEFDGFVNYEDFQARSQLKGFLFDCTIEYLESNCCRYCKCGLKTWAKLPFFMKEERLVHEVKREIKKWACLAGMMPDELIEWEMSHSTGKWTDFDIEAFEAGVEIDGDILQILVDEIVEDLADCRRARCLRYPVLAY